MAGSSPADPSDDGPVDDASLTLLERLDRRQNTVLSELDRLNDSIERMVAHCQLVRQQSQPAP